MVAINPERLIVVAAGPENGGWEYAVNEAAWTALPLYEQTNRIVSRAVEEKTKAYGLLDTLREKFLKALLKGVSNERIRRLIHEVWDHLPEIERVFLERMQIGTVETKTDSIVAECGQSLRAAAMVISDRDSELFSGGAALYLNMDCYADDDWVWRYTLAHEFVHLAYRHSIIIEFASGPEAIYSKEGKGISLFDACEAQAKNQAIHWLAPWFQSEQTNS